MLKALKVPRRHRVDCARVFSVSGQCLRHNQHLFPEKDLVYEDFAFAQPTAVVQMVLLACREHITLLPRSKCEAWTKKTLGSFYLAEVLP